MPAEHPAANTDSNLWVHERWMNQEPTPFRYKSWTFVYRVAGRVSDRFTVRWAK